MTAQAANNHNRPQIISVWPSTAPGSENWNYSEQEWFADPPVHLRCIRNVSRPTLTAFYPDPAKANGTAVIVCPGGGHLFLNIDEEGFDMARWLAGRGVTAFVLKYRLIKTAEDENEGIAEIRKAFSDGIMIREQLGQYGPLAIADGQQAVKLVRSHAAEWGIDPDRIGIMGFSAGGHVAAGVAIQHDADSRPNFAAPIYGALWDEVIVPPDAPPLFIALANNDPIAVEPCLRLYSAWTKANIPVEMHVYSTGGHGFSTRTQGLPVDHWLDRFGDWLQVQSLINSE